MTDYFSFLFLMRKFKIYKLASDHRNSFKILASLCRETEGDYLPFDRYTLVMS